MKKLFLLLCAFLGLGCTKTTSTIPNLAEVEPGLWRSGQPVTDADWQSLRDKGVRHVVKLNFDGEGSDAGAVKAGMDVHVLSIEPRGDQDVFDNVKNVFVQPDQRTLNQIETVIEAGGGVLVHCQHGQDRTGYVIGRYRVIHEHWTKDAAYKEMLVHGFHPELRGLRESWESWRP